MSEPTQPLTGQTTETSNDNLVPPGMTAHERVEDDAVLQVTRLAQFLETAFPDEIALSNRQQPEAPVETAIRLLQSFASKTPPSQIERCATEYCNKVSGHTDEHGWVHAG